MELLPPISASLGAMVSLAGKLDALQLDTELKDEVMKLKARLLKLSKAPDPPATVSTWMNDVRELSYDMDNCVDAGEDWIDQMPGFKARVKEANGRYDRYIPEIVPSPTGIVRKHTDPVVGLYGTGGPVDRLSQRLSDKEKKLIVVPILGGGGIGKTTLVKQIWRHNKLGDFHCRAFVRTAKKPDMRRILRSILAQVRPHQPPDANDVHELIHHLSEHLKDKRYLLIIDDLWATSVWDVASRAFPEGNHGSRIITTTEIEDVALACCSYQSTCIFEVVPLCDSQSKELFSSAVFRSGEQHSPLLEEVTDEIIRRCAGLPQAIISISSVVASQGEANTVQNREQILNSLPTNTTSSEILKQVLKFCYNCLPSCLQTCLLYLSLYPENYIILKEDTIKQWVAEGFILAPTENDRMKVAGSYFDKLVNMGLIQHIDVDYSDEILYYAVHHTVHDLITATSIKENFVTVMDYSQRTVRFSNNVSRLSLQFGSATHATSPASTTTGLSQVRSLAFFGLMSSQPSIFEFKLLRSLILHIWADQPRTGVDLRRISELLLLRYLQVRCNDIVHLPDQLQGLKQLETLEINARVADIPENIAHLRGWLHLRLGVGTELPDVTGVLKNVTLNPHISLDESSSPPGSMKTFELFQPICRIPKWIRQLTNLCVLKFVVRELKRDDINNLQRLPLTFLSLHIQRRTTGLIGFAAGAFAALEYFEFRCGVLCLAFEEGSMPNLQRLKLCFNAHRGEQYGGFLVGIQDMLSVQNISVLIGSAPGAGEREMNAAESAVKKALGQHHSNVSVKRADMVEEEFDPPEKHHSVLQKAASSEKLEIPKQEYSLKDAIGKHPSDVSIKRVDMVKEKYDHAEKQHVVGEKDASSKRPAIPEQESEEEIKENDGSDSQFIQTRSNRKEDANVVEAFYENRELGSGTDQKVDMGEERQNSLGRGNNDMYFTLALIKTITNDFLEDLIFARDGWALFYKAVHNGKYIAVKRFYHSIILDDKLADEMFTNEFRNLTKAHHKNIIRLTGYCYESEHVEQHGGGHIFAEKAEKLLCFEYMQGGSLFNHIEDESCGLDWPTCYQIIQGTCEGLNHLHNAQEKPIFHLDLKPANILLDGSMTPKIAGFGSSRCVASVEEEYKSEYLTISRGYTPPEHIYDGTISKKSDVFSLGVIIIKMMLGNMGISRSSELSPEDFIELVSEKWKVRLQAMSEYSSHKIDIIRVRKCAEIALRCMETNREKRPSIEDIVHELREY